MKPKLFYIHGLNSDATSRKYLNLKAYFRDVFEFDCLEWKNDDNISELLDRAELELDNEINPIIFGDSTGANFAWQLRERRIKKNQRAILILSSPLLNIHQGIADFEFPESLIPYLKVIENPKDTLIIASEKDEIISMSSLFQSEYEKNFKLIEVEDTHRLIHFKIYLPEVGNYIENQRYLNL